MSRRSSRSTAFLLAALVVTLSAPGLAQDSTSNLGDALTNGTFSLGLRYRFGNVDQDDFDDAGKASTLRTTLAYRTLWWAGLQIYAEVEDVHDLGYGSEHNNAGAGSLWNGVSDRPVIADPEITEFNQAYLGIRPAEDVIIRAGLQELVIDNSRFVGNVGWRQNHQSFEAARNSLARPDGGLALSYTYIDRTHTVTGASRPMSTQHADLGYTSGVGTLKGYYLEIDYDEEAFWGLSTRTYGGFLAGKSPLGGSTSLIYRLEYARQDDTGDNPDPIDADYWLVDLGLESGKLTVAAGWEVLEGDPESGAFSTPLATLHAFNGWADKFLVTPAEGLEDLYASLSLELGRWSVMAVYHDFSANTGDAEWGTEVDAHILYTAPWEQKFALRAALYEADQWLTDTTKIWFWTSWGF